LITVTLSNIIYTEELEFVQRGDGIVSLTVQGHALFGDIVENKARGLKKGESIVCAAVSYAALTLLKSIKIIGDMEPRYTLESGLLRLAINWRELDPKRKNVLKILLESFIIGMLEIREKYRGIIDIHFI
jgi:uncharacterized protein YsxB (DUF464 family)